MDNLYAAQILLDYIRRLGDNLIVVFSDAGGMERVRVYAKRLGVGLAIVDKRREGPNQAHAMQLIGDVKGKIAVVLDDMIDTAGTMTAAGNLLAEHGAEGVVACATHAVLSGPAVERLISSAFSQIIVTDTIPMILFIAFSNTSKASSPVSFFTLSNAS